MLLELAARFGPGDGRHPGSAPLPLEIGSAAGARDRAAIAALAKMPHMIHNTGAAKLVMAPLHSCAGGVPDERVLEVCCACFDAACVPRAEERPEKLAAVNSLLSVPASFLRSTSASPATRHGRADLLAARGLTYTSDVISSPCSCFCARASSAPPAAALLIVCCRRGDCRQRHRAASRRRALGGAWRNSARAGVGGRHTRECSASYLEPTLSARSLIVPPPQALKVAIQSSLRRGQPLWREPRPHPAAQVQHGRRAGARDAAICRL